MKVLSGTVVSKVVIVGGMDSLAEGGTKSIPHSEKLSNVNDRVVPPSENGTNNNRWSFLRKSRKLLVQTNCSSCSDGESKMALFGQLLSKVCDGNENLPKPITEMLRLLLRRGSATEGVFRRPGNSKCLKELKGQLNEGMKVDMEAQPVVLLAALVKDFLRELPGSLLVVQLYDAWMMALEKEDMQQKYTELRRVTDKLPRPNTTLLKYLLCLLHHISKNADTNRMDAHNLAVCIAPNLLQCDNLADVGKVTVLTQFLIENCCEIFGEHIQRLLGDPGEEEQAEISDSLSSHQHDSAYDSTDPDADGDHEGAKGRHVAEDRDVKCQQCPSSPVCRAQRTSITNCSSDTISTFPKPFPRRSSEPVLFPLVDIKNLKVLARSHDDFSTEVVDFSLENHSLTKQKSDSILQPGQIKRPPGFQNLSGSLTMEKPIAVSKDCSCSSNCSLESSFSNLSEHSVFTSSPLPSPPNSRKSSFVREEVQNLEEVKRRSQSMNNEKKKPLRTKSWAAFPYSRGSLKKGEKECTLSCEILQEDSQREAEPADPPPRPRPLSAIEVFQQVDSKIPTRPPSYEQAIHSGIQPAPPVHRRMTVQDAWMLERRSRPSSMNEDLLSFCSVKSFVDCCREIRPSMARDSAGPVEAERAQGYRQSAMSELTFKTRSERMAHRCSQPLFEDMSYAKESYV